MEELPHCKLTSSVILVREEAKGLAKSIGLPLIIRPSYTLGGTGGGIAHTMEELESVVANGLDNSMSHEVLVEQCVL
ncbi:unnamed protein product, partial [marine sediment metagenome]